MKLLFDNNLAERLVVGLESLYPDSQHMRALGMAKASDEDIWIYAQKHGMAIVSEDSDFYHRSMVRGYPPKVVWIRLGNCRTDDVADLLRSKHADILDFDQDSSASFLALP